MLIIVMMCFITIIGCSKNTGTKTPEETVSPPPTPGYSYTDIREWWLDSNTAFEMWSETDDAVIIDVRESESFLQRHVSGAVNVQSEDLTAFAAENIPDKDTLIITYCFCGGMGGPALSARNLLAGLGYTNVFYTDPEGEWEYNGSNVSEGTDMNNRIITGDEAKEIVDSNDTVILLDVRNLDEYEELHIEGSVLIPVAELEARLDELPQDKETIIIVYCRGGVRSAAAFEILIENGYTDIYDMQMVTNWPDL